MRDRNIRQRKIKTERKVVSKDNIQLHEPEISDIPGKGLHWVVKRNNRVYYNKWNQSLNRSLVFYTPICFDTFNGVPARALENNIHGGILKLADAQALGPATPANDVTVTKGTGKLFVVINAGTDLAGTFTVTGDTVNRNTGVVTVGDTDTITVDALTTDSSTTDSNSNIVHSFTGAYITSKWFTGTVVLSTSTLNLSDIDVFHVSFEQFGDNSDIILDTFDANIYTTNIAAEFDAYLHTLHVTGSKCNIDREAELHVGADGQTAIADKYWRLRRGNIAETMDGNTDGFWVDIHYANSPVYVESVTIKVWARKKNVILY